MIIEFKYKKSIEQTIDTFAPIYWYLNVFSLNYHLNEQNRGRKFWLFIRAFVSAVVFCSMTLCTMYYKVAYAYQLLVASVKYTDAVQAVYDCIQYVVDLISIFKYGTDIYFEYINQYACIDEMLGMMFYKLIKKNLLRVSVMLLCMWLCNSVYDYVTWMIGFGFFQSSIFFLSYIFTLTKILTSLDLTAHVMHIKIRLRLMGDTIQDNYSAFEKVCPKFEDTITKSNWFYNDFNANNHSSKPAKRNLLHCEDVKWISRCYLLLTEQVTFINKMFGTRILLNSLSFLIDIVRYTNLSVRVLMGNQDSGYNEGYLPAISTMWKAMTCIMTLVSLVHHCEQTYRQRERITRLIDHLMFYRNLDDKLLASIKNLRDLIESRTITFHMANFITLNYSLLVSITSVVVTYTIILLQNFN